MTDGELVKNIMRGAFRLLPYLLETVDVNQVRQISIKGYNSPSLPIYNFVDPAEVQAYLSTPIQWSFTSIIPSYITSIINIKRIVNQEVLNRSVFTAFQISYPLKSTS